MGNKYLTYNKDKDAASKDWVIRLKASRPVKQASVKIRTKTYAYASKYEVQPGDIAVVGLQNNPKSRGEMGVVENTNNRLTIGKASAADLAFVFTPNQPDKKMITACIKYIESGDVDAIDSVNILPITFKVRKIIAASCIIAYPNLSSADDIEMAKAVIAKPQHMSDVPMADYYSIEFYDGYANASPTIGRRWLDGATYFDMKGEEKEQFEDEFNRRVFCDAIGLMLRGGFANLLEAFLSANPPIEEFIDEVINAAGKAYNDKTMEILKSYK